MRFKHVTVKEKSMETLIVAYNILKWRLDSIDGHDEMTKNALPPHFFDKLKTSLKVNFHRDHYAHEAAKNIELALEQVNHFKAYRWKFNLRRMNRNNVFFYVRKAVVQIRNYKKAYTYEMTKIEQS